MQAAVIGLSTLGFFAIWALGGRELLISGLERQNERAVEQAIALYEHHEAQVRDRLRSEARLMGEDPRLRSLLGTPGIDQATILDLLRDLGRETNANVLAALSPAGSVLAVVGPESFEGMDLGSSRFLREAREQGRPITGVWIIGSELTWVSTFAIRFGDRVVGYLVHGYRLDQTALNAIQAATGVGLGLVVSDKLVRSAPEDPDLRATFEQASKVKSAGAIHLLTGGKNIVARARVLEGALPPACFVWLGGVGASPLDYETLGYLLWVPVLVAFAIGLFVAWRKVSV